MYKDVATDDLIEQEFDLDQSADLIEHQLEMAEISGDYDEVWYSKAKYAMRCKRRQVRRINRVLDQRTISNTTN